MSVHAPKGCSIWHGPAEAEARGIFWVYRVVAVGQVGPFSTAFPVTLAGLANAGTMATSPAKQQCCPQKVIFKLIVLYGMAVGSKRVPHSCPRLYRVLQKLLDTLFLLLDFFSFWGEYKLILKLPLTVSIS